MERAVVGLVLGEMGQRLVTQAVRNTRVTLMTAIRPAESPPSASPDGKGGAHIVPHRAGTSSENCCSSAAGDAGPDRRRRHWRSGPPRTGRRSAAGEEPRRTRQPSIAIGDLVNQRNGVAAGSAHQLGDESQAWRRSSCPAGEDTAGPTASSPGWHQIAGQPGDHEAQEVRRRSAAGGRVVFAAWRCWAARRKSRMKQAADRAEAMMSNRILNPGPAGVRPPHRRSRRRTPAGCPSGSATSRCRRPAWRPCRLPASSAAVNPAAALLPDIAAADHQVGAILLRSAAGMAGNRVSSCCRSASITAEGRGAGQRTPRPPRRGLARHGAGTRPGRRPGPGS